MWETSKIPLLTQTGNPTLAWALSAYESDRERLLCRGNMDKFQEIRPYQDDEVKAVLESLLRDAEMLDSIARFYAPNFSRVLPFAARIFARST